MAKIKKTDINKLSKLEQQIEDLKAQKKKEEQDIANKIGQYFVDNIDFEEVENTEELYKLIDEVINKAKNNQTNTNETELENNNIVDEKEAEEETTITN